MSEARMPPSLDGACTGRIHRGLTDRPVHVRCVFVGLEARIVSVAEKRLDGCMFIGVDDESAPHPTP